MSNNFPPPASLVELSNITKHFSKPSSQPFTALADVNLSIKVGELVAVVGKSGSGKSTLLNLVAGLDRPTSGEVRVAGASLHNMSEDSLAAWRGGSVGIVFQFFQLMPTLTVLENVLLAMDFRGVIPRRERRNRTQHLLESVNIAEQADKLPAMLSGGEQQRAAIARALANDPPLIVADEPTGSLDSRTAGSMLELFAGLVEHGKTLLVVTHDEELWRSAAHRIVRLADGMVADDHILRARSNV